VVGEPHRWHLELGRADRQFGDATGPVEDRVLGVDVEVDERRFPHGDRIVAPASDSLSGGPPERRGETPLRRIGPV
jgi:hypothetical protein